MAFISDTVNSVVDAATGSSSGTNLQQFLSKFGSSEGKYVNTINPLATFDVSMKLHPSAAEATLSKTDKVLNALGTAATSAINNLGNNLTGGLMSSLMNDIMGSSVKD